MNLLLTIKNLEHKEKLVKIIESKSNKFQKYLKSNFRITWNYFSENGMHLSEVKVSGFSGPEIKASAKSDNMFKVIDIAINKLEAQLRKKSERQKNKRKQKLIDYNDFQ